MQLVTNEIRHLGVEKITERSSYFSWLLIVKHKEREMTCQMLSVLSDVIYNKLNKINFREGWAILYWKSIPSMVLKAK